MLRKVATMATVVAAVLTTACGTGGTGPNETQQSGAITQVRIPFGDLPSDVVTLGGYVWVLDRRDNVVGKIDPDTNEVVDQLDLSAIVGGRGFMGWDLEAAGRRIWVTVPHKNRLFGLDPQTGEVVSTIRMAASSAFACKGSLWFVGGSGRGVVLVRARARTGKTIARFRLGPQNSSLVDVVSIEDSVWVIWDHARHIGGRGRNPTWFLKTHIWQIDPASTKVLSRSPLGSTYSRGPTNPVIGDVETTRKHMWMSRVYERRLTLMGPTNLRVRKVISLPKFDLPWEFAMVAGDLWVGDLNTQEVAWIDSETGDREMVDVGSDTSFIGSGFGSAWVPVGGPSPDAGAIIRLTRN